MAITLQTNVAALTAAFNLSRTQALLDRNLSHLSSGFRITNASDDAAGLALSERFKAQVRGFAQASRNAQDGISMTQVAEGALESLNNILIRLRELGVQAANGTYGSDERSFLNTEYALQKIEINRIASVTDFAGLKLLNGQLSVGVTFQVGIQNSPQDRITISLASARLSALGTVGLLQMSLTSVATVTNAQSALSVIDLAINTVSRRRATIGAAQNRMTTTINNLSVSRENLLAANSRIRDADVAEETSQLSQRQILLQAGAAVLGQANQIPAIALSLLGR
jgi:flagellin